MYSSVIKFGQKFQIRQVVVQPVTILVVNVVTWRNWTKMAFINKAMLQAHAPFDFPRFVASAESH
jgi:hypothetical protein